MEEVTKKVRDEAVPVSFDRHVYFLNFSQFDRQSPTYINLVRDPVEKAASRSDHTHPLHSTQRLPAFSVFVSGEIRSDITN